MALLAHSTGFFFGEKDRRKRALAPPVAENCQKKGKGGISFPFSSSPFSLLEFTALPSPPFPRTWEYDVQVCTLQYPVNHRPPPQKCCTYVRHSPLHLPKAAASSFFFSSGAPLVVPPHSAGKVGFWAGRFSGRPEKGGEEGGIQGAIFHGRSPLPPFFPSTASRFWRMKGEGGRRVWDPPSDEIYTLLGMFTCTF